MADIARPISRRTKHAHWLIAPLAALALSACAPIDQLRVTALGIFDDRTLPATEPLAEPLAPVDWATAPRTSTFTARDLLGGGTLGFESRKIERGVRVSRSDGCAWTRSDDWFAPSDSWSNCDDSAQWHSGSAEVRRLASIWPLQPGSVGRWTRDATSHTGRTYTRETTCRVVRSEAVLREGRAPTPAHVVVCTDGKRTRTTWFAPDEGPVAFHKRHAENGVEEAWIRF